MFWNWNTQSPGEVIGGKGILRVQDVFQLSLGHNFAAARSGARTKIDNVVGRPDCFFVVLDHDHGVPEVSQPSQCAKQTRVVALMQTYARLVQNVKHAGQSGANLCRQPDPLRFAAAEWAAFAIERQVTEAYFDQKLQTRFNFAQDVDHDFLLRGR